MASTVKENKEGFTKRQFDSAKVARAFYHIAGCPTLTNFKHIIRQNIFKNCPVTVADVDVAERFGSRMDTRPPYMLTTSSTPKPDNSDTHCHQH